MPEMIFLIPLTHGFSTVVDADTFEWAAKHKWRALQSGGKNYAVRNGIRNGKRRTILLHREILSLGDSPLEGEHEDGDSLNNLRSNLRPASRSQNLANRERPHWKKKTSKYRGVSWDSRGCFWTAQISINNRKKHLGTFEDEEKAAHAYDAAAKIQFGEFARLNFI